MTLRKVSPFFTVDNFAYVPFRNIKRLCDIFLEMAVAVKRTYLQNLIVGKFTSTRDIHSLVRMSMLEFIYHVLTTGSPAQIYQKTVCFYTVKVHTFMSRRAWSYKSQQDKPINPYGMATQRHNRVATFGQSCFKNPLGLAIQYVFDTPSLSFALANPSPIRPNAAMGAGFIAGKIRNRFPDFFRGVKMVISHGASLLVRAASGLEPVLLLKQRPAHFLYHRLGQNDRKRGQYEL